MNSNSAPPSKFIVGNPGRTPQAPCHRYDDGDDDAEMITINITPPLRRYHWYITITQWPFKSSFLWPIVWKPKNPFPLRFVFSLLQSPPRMSFMLPIFLFVLLFISHICRLTCAIFFTKFPTSNWSWCAQSALLLCIVHNWYYALYTIVIMQWTQLLLCIIHTADKTLHKFPPSSLRIRSNASQWRIWPVVPAGKAQRDFLEKDGHFNSSAPPCPNTHDKEFFLYMKDSLPLSSYMQHWPSCIVSSWIKLIICERPSQYSHGFYRSYISCPAESDQPNIHFVDGFPKSWLWDKGHL